MFYARSLLFECNKGVVFYYVSGIVDVAAHVVAAVAADVASIFTDAIAF